MKQSNDEKKRVGKVKKILQYTTTVLLVLSTVLCFVIVINASQKKDINILGFRLFWVKTGSMEPTIPAGSFLLVKESDVYEDEEIITFYSKDSSIKGYPNTHRIKDIIEKDGSIYYRTKGDAIEEHDTELVPKEDVLGKVCFCFDDEIFGNVMQFLGTPTGFLVVILIPNLLIALSCMRSFIKAMKEEMRRAILEAERLKNVEEEECHENEKESEDTTK